MTSREQQAKWVVPSVLLAFGATALVIAVLLLDSGSGGDEALAAPGTPGSSSRAGAASDAAPGVIVGTVLDDGQPVPDFMVGLYDGAGARVADRFATSDAEGRFRFEDVGVDRGWVLQPATLADPADSRRGWTLVPTSPVEVNVPSDSGLDDVILAVAQANAVTGRLVDGRGHPVAGVDITVAAAPGTSAAATIGDEWARTFTDHEGRYRLGGLPHGAWTIRADQSWTIGPSVGTSGPQAQQVLRALGEQTFHRISTALDEPIDLAGGEVFEAPDLAVARGRVLTGTVRDEGGAPVPGAVVSIADPTSGVGIAQSVTDSDGRYRFVRLKRTTVALGASIDDRTVWNGGTSERAASELVRVRPKQVRTVVDLAFD